MSLSKSPRRWEIFPGNWIEDTPQGTCGCQGPAYRQSCGETPLQLPPIAVPTRRKFQKLKEPESLKWSTGWDLKNSSVHSPSTPVSCKNIESTPL